MNNDPSTPEIIYFDDEQTQTRPLTLPVPLLQQPDRDRSTSTSASDHTRHHDGNWDISKLTKNHDGNWNQLTPNLAQTNQQPLLVPDHAQTATEWNSESQHVLAQGVEQWGGDIQYDQSGNLFGYR